MICGGGEQEVRMQKVRISRNSFGTSPSSSSIRILFASIHEHFSCSQDTVLLEDL
jgi:hypothetical protein